MVLVKEYLSRNYSIIPINNCKLPLTSWKKNQFQRATMEDLFSWYDQFENINLGLVTGKISNLAVIDLDDLNLLSFVQDKIPEINKTTQVKTRRGYHYYFYTNGERIKSTNKLFGENIELKSEGNYVVAPDSIVKDHKYEFIKPLEQILPFPKVITEYQKELLAEKANSSFFSPVYRGKNIDCIRQIIERDLKEGERNISLFILYHLLVNNKNKKEYAINIINNLNNNIGCPLGPEEILNMSAKSYKYSCIKIREMLPYINCDYCQYQFKGDGDMKKSNILLKNIRKLHKISNTQRGILCLLGTTFNQEIPTITEIEKVSKMNYQTVRKALLELQEEGFIEDNIYK